MRISGTSTFAADRTAVWRALNDPAVLVRAIPGCRRLEALGEDRYRMTVAAGVGTVQGVYDGEVRLSDQQEPGSFRLNAKGAGAPGTIGADVWVTLETRGGQTELSYDADAVVGGMIGGVGQRMLTGASKKMAEEFFRNVDAVLLADTGMPAVDGASTGPNAPEAAGATAPAPEAAAGPARPVPGTVFTAPVPSTTARSGFLAGVVVGAAAALAGAVVGAWIAGRRG